MVVNLSAKDFRKERKVHTTLHVLSRFKKQKLLDAPLAEVLDIGFLAHVGLGRSRASIVAARDALALVLSALNVSTLRQLQQLSAEDLARLPKLGNKTLAMLLDLLRAFDIALAEEPHYKKTLSFDGSRLARELGLIT